MPADKNRFQILIPQLIKRKSRLLDMHRSYSLADAQHLLPVELDTKNLIHQYPPISITKDKMMRKVASTSKIIGNLLETFKETPDPSKKTPTRIVIKNFPSDFFEENREKHKPKRLHRNKSEGGQALNLHSEIVNSKKMNLKCINSRQINATPKFNNDMSKISDESIRISQFQEKSLCNVSQPVSPKSYSIPNTTSNIKLNTKLNPQVKTVSVPKNNIIVEKSVTRPGTSDKLSRDQSSIISSSDHFLSKSAIVKPVQSSYIHKHTNDKKLRSSHSITVHFSQDYIKFDQDVGSLMKQQYHSRNESSGTVTASTSASSPFANRIESARGKPSCTFSDLIHEKPSNGHNRATSTILSTSTKKLDLKIKRHLSSGSVANDISQKFFSVSSLTHRENLGQTPRQQNVPLRRRQFDQTQSLNILEPRKKVDLKKTILLPRIANPKTAPSYALKSVEGESRAIKTRIRIQPIKFDRVKSGITHTYASSNDMSAQISSARTPQVRIRSCNSNLEDISQFNFNSNPSTNIITNLTPNPNDFSFNNEAGDENFIPEFTPDTKKQTGFFRDNFSENVFSTPLSERNENDIRFNRQNSSAKSNKNKRRFMVDNKMQDKFFQQEI